MAGQLTPHLQRLASLLTLRAFRPDAHDMTAPLRERFEGQSLLGIAVYPESVKSAEIEFTPEPRVTVTAVAPRPRSGDEELAEVIRSLPGAKAGRPAALCYNFGYNAVKSLSVKRNPGNWALLKNRPEQVVAGEYEPGMAYSVVQHPSLENAIVFSYNMAVSGNLERVVEQAGLRCVRLQNSVGAIFDALVLQHAGPLTGPLLVLSGNSILYLEAGPPPDGEWQVLRSRSEYNEAKTAEARRPLGFLGQILPQQGRLLVCLDQHLDNSPWMQLLRDIRPNLELHPTYTPSDPRETAFHALAHD